MNPLTTNDKVGVLHVEVDKTRDLAPQVIVLRSIGLPWKLIEQLTGRPKNRLEEQITAFAARLQGRAILPETAKLDLRQSPAPSARARRSGG